MKPSRIVFFLILNALTCSLFSRDIRFITESYESISALGEELDDNKALNDKVQNVFFDTPFGSSKQDVCYRFIKHGLSLSQMFSDDSHYVFLGSEKTDFVIKFAGIGFHQVDVNFNLNKFYSIIFINTYKNKESALEEYKKIENALSQKYKLSDDMQNDKDLIKMVTAYGRNSCDVSVSCWTYETIIGKEIRYSTRLSYTNRIIENKEEEINFDEL